MPGSRPSRFLEWRDELGHTAIVTWEREGAVFSDSRYSRAHRWTFDGGITVVASSSPHVVPVPMSQPEAVDPEEAFVASLSSCHMLTFLWIAARRGFVVEHYHDEAVGVLSRDAGGQLAMTSVVLRPRVTFAERPHSGSRGARGDAPRGARPVLHCEVGEDGRTLRAGRGGRLTALTEADDANREDPCRGLALRCCSVSPSLVA